MHQNPQIQVQLVTCQWKLIQQNGSYFHILKNQGFLLPTALYSSIDLFYFTVYLANFILEDINPLKISR